VTPPDKFPAEIPRYTGDYVVEKFEGKGIGRQTLPLICQQLNLDYVRIKQKLISRQMVISHDETLKDAATRLGVTPIELLKDVLIGEPITP